MPEGKRPRKPEDALRRLQEMSILMPGFAMFEGPSPRSEMRRLLRELRASLRSRP